MILATTKERLLQYLEAKEISTSSFLKETGIKRGFLDTDKLKASVSDIFLTIIIAKYTDLNLEWIITGKGEMLKSNVGKKKKEESKEAAIQPDYNNIIRLECENNFLQKECTELKKDKEFLQSIIVKGKIKILDTK